MELVDQQPSQQTEALIVSRGRVADGATSSTSRRPMLAWVASGWPAGLRTTSAVCTLSLSAPASARDSGKE